MRRSTSELYQFHWAPENWQWNWIFLEHELKIILLNFEQQKFVENREFVKLTDWRKSELLNSVRFWDIDRCIDWLIISLVFWAISYQTFQFCSYYNCFLMPFLFFEKLFSRTKSAENVRTRRRVGLGFHLPGNPRPPTNPRIFSQFFLFSPLNFVFLCIKNNFSANGIDVKRSTEQSDESKVNCKTHDTVRQSERTAAPATRAQSDNSDTYTSNCCWQVSRRSKSLGAHDMRKENYSSVEAASIHSKSLEKMIQNVHI